jgi:hypothetical protein
LGALNAQICRPPSTLSGPAASMDDGLHGRTRPAESQRFAVSREFRSERLVLRLRELRLGEERQGRLIPDSP